MIDVSEKTVNAFSSVGLMVVGSLLIVYGANMGYGTEGGLALVFYLAVVFGLLVAAAGVLGFRRLKERD